MRLNAALKRIGEPPAVRLYDAPTESNVRGRRIARMLGFDVAFIEPNEQGLDGVAYEGQAFVSPNTTLPEIGLMEHEAFGH